MATGWDNTGDGSGEIVVDVNKLKAGPVSIFGVLYYNVTTTTTSEYRALTKARADAIAATINAGASTANVVRVGESGQYKVVKVTKTFSRVAA